MSRFFAFGCSYTKYAYATWADYVASNFDEYYNFGLAGSSNTYSMSRFIEADNLLKFNESDYVIYMVTGIGRFSYYPKVNKNEHQKWIANGDLYEYTRNTKDSKVDSFIKNMYSDNYAVYSTWIAVKTIKNILTARSVPHKILMAIDNSNYLEEDGSKWGREDFISDKAIGKTKEIYNTLDVKVSLDEWMKLRSYKQEEHIKWKNINSYDGHPTQKMHLDFVKDNLSEFYTDKAIELHNKVEDIFTDSSQSEQGKRFLDLFHHEFDKTQTLNLY